MSPCVSVIVPVFRGAQYLPRAVESVLAQTHQELVVIVVDDGSPEAVEPVIAPYLRDDRVRYIKKANGGVSSARNAGLRVSSGGYVAFLDHDDVWYPSKLALQIQALDVNPAAGLCHSDVEFMDEEGKTLPHCPGFPANVQGRCLPRMIMGNPVITSTVLMRREVAQALGGFDEQLHHAEDYDLWLRVARRWELAYVDQPLARYRVHEGGATMQTVRMVSATLQVVRRHLHDVPGLSAEVGTVPLRRRIAGLHAALSRHHFEQRHAFRFLRHFGVAALKNVQVAVDRGLPEKVADLVRWYGKRLGVR